MLPLARQSLQRLRKSCLVGSRRLDRRVDARDQHVGIAQRPDASPYIPRTALEGAERTAVGEGLQCAQSASQAAQANPQLVRTIGIVILEHSLAVGEDLPFGRLQNSGEGFGACV